MMNITRDPVDLLLDDTFGALGYENTGSDKNAYLDRYQPHGAALTALEATEPEVLVCGPSRTGKTRANLEKIDRLCRQYKKARWLIVRKTRASLTETALQTFEDHVLAPNDPVLLGPSGKILERRNRQKYVYPNTGSEIVVGGMDNAIRILSSEYDGVYVPEAIELTQNDWETLTTRLSNGVLPYPQIIADTNPDRPTHWLKKRCDEGTTRLIFSDHRDNPLLWNADANDWTERGKVYISKLDSLTGARKQRLRYGKWVQAEGMVYEEWDESIHLIDQFPIPAHWTRYRVVDFGYTNPFVCQWWAVDPDGRLYMYREIYMTQRTVTRHCRLIKQVSEHETYSGKIITDHDAEDRATMHSEGLLTESAEKEVSVGIQATQERFKKAGDGKPRIFIMRDSLVERDANLVEAGKPTCTVEEITGYVWEKGSDGKPSKETPLKIDDHGMDTTRYMVMKLDSKRKMQIIAETREWA